jgi:dienelactone hydrolase
MDRAAPSAIVRSEVIITVGSLRLQGILDQSGAAHGLVLFAHGSGSGRLSSRNQFVASILQREGFTTLLFDLLTMEEEHAERFTRHLRFDITLLAERLSGATRWALEQPALARLPIGYFGASTGAAAALVAAAVAAWSNVYEVGAVVSRGGRPDLAGAALPRVRAPTLLIVGGDDSEVIALNRQALEQLRCEKELRIVPGATHLFEESGTLETAARLATDWFQRHLHAVRSAA